MDDGYVLFELILSTRCLQCYKNCQAVMRIYIYIYIYIFIFVQAILHQCKCLFRRANSCLTGRATQRRPSNWTYHFLKATRNDASNWLGN